MAVDTSHDRSASCWGRNHQLGDRAWSAKDRVPRDADPISWTLPAGSRSTARARQLDGYSNGPPGTRLRQADCDDRDLPSAWPGRSVGPSGGAMSGAALVRWRWAVFARSTSINAQLPMMDNGIAHVRDTVMPGLSHIDGYLGLSLMADRDTGRAIVTSAWRSEDAMRRSAERVMTLRDGAVRTFGASGAAVEEWEVAVMHRAHHAREGTWMRATWVGLDDTDLDDAIQTFKTGTLAKIEDLPGFCSASLMVNRAERRAVTTVGYDDRSSLAYSRDGADAVRDQAARQMDAHLLEVAEFELTLAHLHVPEMV